MILLTNAPRPNPPIREQALSFGVAPEAFDEIVTSGDVDDRSDRRARRPPVHHIGPERDLALFDAAARRLPARRAPRGPTRRPMSCAPASSTTSVETPDDYARRLAALAARGVCRSCAPIPISSSIAAPS